MALSTLECGLITAISYIPFVFVTASGITLVFLTLTIADIHADALQDDDFCALIFWFGHFVVVMLVFFNLQPPLEELSLKKLLGQAAALHIVLLFLWSLAIRGARSGDVCRVLLGLRDGFHKANTDFFRALGAFFMILLDIVHFRWDLPSSPRRPPDEALRTSPWFSREADRFSREADRFFATLTDAFARLIQAVGGQFKIAVDLSHRQWDLPGFKAFYDEHHAHATSNLGFRSLDGAATPPRAQDESSINPH